MRRDHHRAELRTLLVQRDLLIHIRQLEGKVELAALGRFRYGLACLETLFEGGIAGISRRRGHVKFLTASVVDRCNGNALRIIGAGSALERRHRGNRQFRRGGAGQSGNIVGRQNLHTSTLLTYIPFGALLSNLTRYPISFLLAFVRLKIISTKVIHMCRIVLFDCPGTLG